MKVTLLNPEQLKNIFKEWGNFAATCYNTPSQYAENVGNKCYEDEHYSGSRTEYIKFKIEGIDRGIAEQIMRHEIGVRQFPIDENTYDENPNNIVKNMKSFRYVDMDDFEYTIPKTIQDNEYAYEEFFQLMTNINNTRKYLVDTLIENGVPEKQAIEDANYVLPRATNTSLALAFTLEAFIHYLNKRLCTRTQYFHRKLARLMKDEVVKVLPKIEDRLVPQCEHLLWCPEENRSCGRKPTKKELLELIQNGKNKATTNS
jgi:thymidylate synthase (FAD)